MIVFGWVIASIGAVGLCGSVVLEIICGEPVFLLLAKTSAGVLGIGGILIGIKSLRRK